MMAGVGLHDSARDARAVFGRDRLHAVFGGKLRGLLGQAENLAQSRAGGDFAGREIAGEAAEPRDLLAEPQQLLALAQLLGDRDRVGNVLEHGDAA